MSIEQPETGMNPGNMWRNFLLRLRTSSPQQIDTLTQRMEQSQRPLSGQQIAALRQRVTEMLGEEQSVQNRALLERTQLRLNVLASRVQQMTPEQRQQAQDSLTRQAVLTGGGAAVFAGFLGWLGFRGATGQGRTGSIVRRLGGRTVEFAIDHPVMAGFLGAAAIQQGSDAWNYFTNPQVEGPLLQQFEGMAHEQGTSAAQVAQNLGQRLAQNIQTAPSTAVDSIIRSFVRIIPGARITETGAVELPHSTIHHPGVMAYAAGSRGRRLSGFMSKWGLRKQDSALFRTEHVAMRSQEQAALRQQLSERAKQLHARAGSLSAVEQLELNKITKALNRERLSRGSSLLNIAPEGFEKQMSAIIAEAAQQKKMEVKAFQGMYADIHGQLMITDEAMRKGKAPGGQGLIEFKDKTMKTVNESIKSYNDKMRAQKINISSQFAEMMNLQTKNRMNMSGGFIEGKVRSMEKLGYNFTKIPGAGWTTKAMIGYSLLPIGLEAASYFGHMSTGFQRQKQLEVKKQQNALTANEVAELKRLNNQGWTLAKDVGQMGTSFIPIVGEVSDFSMAISGMDWNGRKLGTSARIASAVFGTLGTASLIIAPFTGGGSIVAYKVLRGAGAGARATRVAGQIAKGTRVAANTAEALSKFNKGTKITESANAALKLTKINKTALKAQSGIRTTQRIAQLGFYATMGMQLFKTAHDFYTNGSMAVQNTTQNIATGVENLTNRIPGTQSSPPPPGDNIL